MTARRLAEVIARIGDAILGRGIRAHVEAGQDGKHAGDAPPNTVSTCESALEFTEELPSRTASAFSGVRALYSPVLGTLHNVAQRLIDAKARGRDPNPADEALILLCNRLFNESFAGYIVLSHGLLGAGQHHLRAAVETANLATLFLVKPEHAERWLRGKEYSPGDVRKLVDASEEMREWYSQLSTMTHTNYAASGTSVYPLDAERAQILFYGGHQAPRAMASTTMAFAWVAFAFLRLFYRRYSDQLEELSLLWKPEVAVMVGEIDLTWDRLLELFERMAEQIQDEIHALPEDDVRTPEWAEEILSDWASRSPDEQMTQR